MFIDASGVHQLLQRGGTISWLHLKILHSRILNFVSHPFDLLIPLAPALCTIGLKKRFFSRIVAQKPPSLGRPNISGIPISSSGLKQQRDIKYKTLGWQALCVWLYGSVSGSVFCSHHSGPPMIYTGPGPGRSLHWSIGASQRLESRLGPAPAQPPAHGAQRLNRSQQKTH